jgi:methylmalonyl-CoA/ethylmalonyl-CoA epimerase
MPMVPLLHHVGIIMPTNEEAASFAEKMSLEEDYRGVVEQWQCLCIFMKANGGTAIELVVPSGGPLARFNRGFGGIHHYAIQVQDLEAVRTELLTRDIELLEDRNVKGAGNFICNFINPIYTSGVMIEYVQLV